MDREEIEAIQMRAEEEYEMIKDRCHDLYDENQEALKEIERLKNIINKLEGYIITNKPVYIEQKGTSKIINITDVLLKMIELKENEDNENNR